MTRALYPLALLMLGAMAHAAEAPTNPGTQDVPELETFVLTGEVPGPALWKVMHKDHVLWILPTLGPLPDRMVWRSTQVEEVILNSQQVYADARISVMRPSERAADERLLKALSNQDGKVLLDVMPPDLYEKFVYLSQRYGSHPGFFTFFRPFQATDMLRQYAMEYLELTSDGGVVATVQKLAAFYQVPVLAPKPIESREWDRVIAQLDRTPREADIPCARARLQRLEPDLRKSIERANAWGRGDIAALRSDAGLQYDGTDIEVCKQFFRHMTFTRDRMLELRKRSFKAYQDALKKNRSTLALVPIIDLFDDEGLVARFKASGYQVEEP